MKKYPFVKQISDSDCGQACVSMVLKKLIDSNLTLGQIGILINALRRFR